MKPSRNKALEPEQLVVRLLEVASVGRVEDGAEEVRHKGLGVKESLGQTSVGLGGHVVNLSGLGLPLLGGVGLLGELQELVLGDLGVLDVDGPVLGLLGVAENADNGVGDGAEGGGGEGDVTAVEDGGLAVGMAQDEVVLQAPVEEGRVVHECVGDRRSLGLLNEVVLDLDLVGKDGELPGVGEI
ncbi:unnamed protein product [Clonostachys chloroleuca]|uniref:Uncharacterized protein n=1 Tax=Clonostachys chloroleuca TaxID=1926264 RepID=A0AA35QFU5_9HYPO|nr:unnamed protein product [Clonostachys chloroleuca]